MGSKKLLRDIKSNASYINTILKYSSKCKKLGIGKDFLSFLAYRVDSHYVIEVLSIIKKSKDRNQFQENVLELVKKSPRNTYNPSLLVGNILGKYEMFEYYNSKNVVNLINNFKYENKEKIIEILRENFCEYAMSKNKIKNNLYEIENNIRDFKKELPTDIVKIFDNVLMGIEESEEKKKIVFEYIYLIVNNYPIDYIINDFEFIKYDMISSELGDLEERKSKYDKHKNLDADSLIRINKVEILKSKLKRINNEDALVLLNRLSNIDEYYTKAEELKDIYLEYEMLFREDILNRLFVPKEKETLIEDFRDVRPQLIHCFIRNIEKFRKELEKQIIDKILSERKPNYGQELSDEEKERVKNLYNRMEVELDTTQVNYSFETNDGLYSDTTGIGYYKSDTKNQIAASIYSDEYFNKAYGDMIGIGFNSESIVPESIILSSTTYLTTNKGLNNFEYDETKEFELMSSCYDELIENDGKSEIVMFRRNIDFDTKAAYVFVAFDSQYSKHYKETIEKGRKMAQKNNMKLVIYDMAKIRESYEQSLIQSNENINEIQQHIR